MVFKVRGSTALYTNIPHKEGLSALRYFLDARPDPTPPTDTLVRLAELVLTLNTFEFDSKFYQQVNGVAMGTKMGPSYACLYMGSLEAKLFAAYTGPKPEYFGRYIDDCLLITSLSEPDLISFIKFANNLDPAIKFTYEISTTQIPFLDILISLNQNTISTSIFYKPTASHAYLDYTSAHSTSTRNAIPYSQFLRLKRLCSSDDDFSAKSEEMVTFFSRRNYPPALTVSSLERAKAVPRTTTLSQPPRIPDTRPRVILTYHPHHLPIKKILLNRWDILQQDPNSSECFPQPPSVSYRRGTNLKDHLVRSKLTTLPPTPANPGTRPCNKDSCGVCPFLDNSVRISGPKSNFTVRRNFHCQLSNIIYAIRCIAPSCLNQKVMYIGETGRTFETRIKEHLASIRNKKSTSVARHFTETAGHSPDAFRAQVLWQLKNDNVVDRKLLETDFINRFGTMQPYGLNMKQ